MAGSPSARSMSVPIQKNCTLVVLIDYIVFHVVALLDHEISRPYHERHPVVNADEFGLDGALCVQLLADRAREWRTFSK